MRRAQTEVEFAERDLVLTQLRLYNARVQLKQLRGEANAGFIFLATM